jgi:chemotaxis protein CheD
MDVFLQPGEVYFGDAETRVRTLLGSCVAVTLWHPARRIGGMCHYMLPARKCQPNAALNGKYADEALQLLRDELTRAHTAPADYQAKLFGGGNMFAPPSAPRPGANVSDRNVSAGRRLLERHGFRVCAEDLGGPGHRQIIFDIGSGAVWVRRHPLTPPSTRIDQA